MKTRYFQLLPPLLTAALRALASSEEPNPNGNGVPPFWPHGPYWNSHGNPPQPQMGGEPIFPAQYGTWPQNIAMNGQGPQGMPMGWPTPYGFQPFPPPGYMPGPAPYYGNFMPGMQAAPNLNTGTEHADGEDVANRLDGEIEPMTVDDSILNLNTVPGTIHARTEIAHIHRPEQRANTIAGSSQPRHVEMTPHRTREDPSRRITMMDSTSKEDEPPCKRDTGKGKRRATREEMMVDE